MIRFPHIDQETQKVTIEVTTSSWKAVLMQFVSHALSNLDLMSQLAGWSPIKDGPPLFIKSEREGYCQVRAELYMFEYYSAP